MAKNIHPEYYTKAHIKCACGNEFIVGATQKELEVETCSRCHPVYTGQERSAVRGGRVEKFQERIQKKSDYRKKSEKRAKKKEETPPTSSAQQDGQTEKDSSAGSEQEGDK